MTRPFRHSLLALAIASLLAPLAAQADGKGRWINDGFGRSTRDGKGSTCLAAGGDTHAFANADCEGGGDGAKAKAKAAAPATAAPAAAPKAAGGAPAPIIVESRSLDPAPAAPALPPPTIRDSSGKAVRDGVSRACVNDSRGSTGVDCNASSLAAPSPAPAPAAATTPAPAPQAPSGAGAGTGTGAAAAAAATGAAVAAASLADETAALADTDDDDYENTPEAEHNAMDDADDETPWLADGSGPEDDVLADGADTAPVYAGESLWGEPAAAAAVAVDPGKRESDTAPIASSADQAPAEFPVTRYSVDDAAAEPPRKDQAAKPAGTDNRPAPLLQKTLQMDKGALFDSNSAVLKRRTIPELDELAAFLRKAGNYEAVTVIGHTDRLGSDKLNQRLSEKRAKAVRDYLVMRGVDPARITSSGKGRNQPVTAAGACDRLKKKALRACLGPDRRVEIEAIATVTETVKPK